MPRMLLCYPLQDYSLSKCGFRIRKAKLGAARVVANREFGCAGAYTLEASLGGRAQGRSHFSAADYIGLGENLCRCVCVCVHACAPWKRACLGYGRRWG